MDAILVDVKQACRLLSISRRTLHDLIRKDGLPVVRLSSGPKAGLRFRLADLESWAAQRVERLSEAHSGNKSVSK
jgi:excisionase family DNA binding protein